MCVCFDTSSQRTHYTHYTPLRGVGALCPWAVGKPTEGGRAGRCFRSFLNGFRFEDDDKYTNTPQKRQNITSYLVNIAFYSAIIDK